MIPKLNCLTAIGKHQRRSATKSLGEKNHGEAAVNQLIEHTRTIADRDLHTLKDQREPNRQQNDSAICQTGVTTTAAHLHTLHVCLSSFLRAYRGVTSSNRLYRSPSLHSHHRGLGTAEVAPQRRCPRPHAAFDRFRSPRFCAS